MRKLIESTLVSLDGVIGAPDGWANFDDEATALSIEQLGNYDAFIMGRVTDEYFFANWGQIAGNPYIGESYWHRQKPAVTAANDQPLDPPPATPRSSRRRP